MSNSISWYYFNMVLKNILISQGLLRQLTTFFFKLPLQDAAQSHFSMSSCTLRTPANSHMVHCQKLMYLPYGHHTKSKVRNYFSKIQKKPNIVILRPPFSSSFSVLATILSLSSIMQFYL